MNPRDDPNFQLRFFNAKMKYLFSKLGEAFFYYEMLKGTELEDEYKQRLEQQLNWTMSQAEDEWYNRK